MYAYPYISVSVHTQTEGLQRSLSPSEEQCVDILVFLMAGPMLSCAFEEVQPQSFPWRKLSSSANFMASHGPRRALTTQSGLQGAPVFSADQCWVGG